MCLRPDFFKEPMIAATPCDYLNDPFEGWFNETQVIDADRQHELFYKKSTKKLAIEEDQCVNGIMEVIQSELLDSGVISFSEDYNNLLMWAHYADEHKGMVVEFDFSLGFFPNTTTWLDRNLIKSGENYDGNVFIRPKKVNYRRAMPSFDREELSVPEPSEEFHWKKFNETILFTKGDDWIYEKEQRCIVKLIDADSIICEDSSEVNFWAKKVSGIDIIKLESGKLKITYPVGYKDDEGGIDNNIRLNIYLATRLLQSPSVYLFRINPLAISRIYFGCNSKPKDCLEALKSHTDLSINNIDIFKMKQHENEYQLVPYRL